MLTHLPIHRWIGRPPAINTLSLQQTLFNLLVAFVFFPTLMLMMLDSRQVMDNIRTSSVAELSVASSNLKVEVQTWHNQHLQAIAELAQLAARTPLETASPVLQQGLELTQAVFNDFANLWVVNRVGVPLLTATPATATHSAATTSAIALLSHLPLNQLAKQAQTQLFSFVEPGNPSVQLLWCTPIQGQGAISGFVVAAVDPNGGLGTLLRSHMTSQGLQVTLVDADQTMIVSTNPSHVGTSYREWQHQGDLQSIDAQTYQWFPRLGSPLVLVRWSNSFFVHATAIAPKLPWTLVVELPAKPQVRLIEQVHTKNLSILLLISGTSLFFANVLSRRLLNPLSQLTQVTTNLPNKLLERELIQWPRSSVTELDTLVRNFQSMAASLNQKFGEIKNANEMLEERVQERTKLLSM